MTSHFMKSMMGASVAVALAAAAHALTITPSTFPQVTGSDNSNLTASQIATLVGAPTLFELYKADVGSADSGLFANSYTTTYSNTASDPSDALIHYVGSPNPVPTAEPIYAYVKDGNAQPAFYVFTISGWNGTDDLVFDNFWPNQGAISHITLLGGVTTGEVPGPGPNPGTGVPDGGTTILLFGTALTLLGVLRKKLLR
jgi:hypothetical protein